MKFILGKRMTRVKKRFALFPIKIGYEVRWLETVYIKQKRVEPFLEWISCYFTDETEYLKEIEKNRYIDVDE